jgi:hypothetical protein
MSLVTGTISDFRGTRNAVYPNDETPAAPTKTLSITRQQTNITVAQAFAGETADTWHDLTGITVTAAPGTHYIGYKILMASQSTGTGIPIAQCRLVDENDVYVPGTISSMQGINSNFTTGGGLSPIFACRTQITVGVGTDYKVQVRRRAEADLNVNVAAPFVSGTMAGDDDTGFIFLDTITYA